MSASYKCNFCNKKISRRSTLYSQTEWISKEVKGTHNRHEVSVTFKIDITNSGLDICTECSEEIKKEALKKFNKNKIECRNE